MYTTVCAGTARTREHHNTYRQQSPTYAHCYSVCVRTRKLKGGKAQALLRGALRWRPAQRSRGDETLAKVDAVAVDCRELVVKAAHGLCRLSIEDEAAQTELGVEARRRIDGGGEACSRAGRGGKAGGCTEARHSRGRYTRPRQCVRLRQSPMRSLEATPEEAFPYTRRHPHPSTC